MKWTIQASDTFCDRLFLLEPNERETHVAEDP